MTDGFADAEFYDANDNSENLQHTTPEEALFDALEWRMVPGCDAAAIIQAVAPIDVEGYRRDVVEETWLESRADSLLEQAAENIVEEYGDPNGEDLPTEAMAATRPLMLAAVRDLVSRMDVWRCAPSGRRTYSPDEVEALMREHAPDWFEVEE